MAFDRFILASNFERIETRFGMAKQPEHVDYIPSYNIAPGDKTYIINNNQTKEIVLFDFGLLVNGDILPFIRAEGDWNSEDNPNYIGSKAIFLKPEFNRLIRHQRFSELTISELHQNTSVHMLTKIEARLIDHKPETIS